MGGFLYWSEIKGVLPLLLPKKRNRKKVFFICYADSKLKDSLCLLIFIFEVAILFATYDYGLTWFWQMSKHFICSYVKTKKQIEKCFGVMSPTLPFFALKNFLAKLVLLYCFLSKEVL